MLFGSTDFFANKSLTLERLQSAKNVYEAFKKSYCSLEVKSAARDAAENYNLDEY